MGQLLLYGGLAILAVSAIAWLGMPGRPPRLRKWFHRFTWFIALLSTGGLIGAIAFLLVVRFSPDSPGMLLPLALGAICAIFAVPAWIGIYRQAHGTGHPLPRPSRRALVCGLLTVALVAFTPFALYGILLKSQPKRVTPRFHEGVATPHQLLLRLAAYDGGPPKLVYSPGEPVHFDVELLNGSKEKLSVYKAGLTQPRCGIVRVTSVGDHGQWDAQSEPAAALRADFAAIEGRKSFTCSGAFSAPEKLGTYQLVARYLGRESFLENGVIKQVADSWTREARSASLDIQVVDPARLAELDRVYMAFLAALRSGVESRVRAVTTGEGFASLPVSRGLAEWQQSATGLSMPPMQWKSIEVGRATAARFGQKEVDLQFRKLDGVWKLDRYRFSPES